MKKKNPFYRCKAFPLAPPQPPLVKDTLNQGCETPSIIKSKCHRTEILSTHKRIIVSRKSVSLHTILNCHEEKRIEANCHEEKSIEAITDNVLCKQEGSQIVPAMQRAIRVVLTVYSTCKLLRHVLW